MPYFLDTYLALNSPITFAPPQKVRDLSRRKLKPSSRTNRLLIPERRSTYDHGWIKLPSHYPPDRVSFSPPITFKNWVSGMSYSVTKEFSKVYSRRKMRGTS